MFETVQQRAATLARDGLKVRRLVASCNKLLSERGEAAGVSQAKITLDLYRELDRKEQARFFSALRAEFSPDPMQVQSASQAYVADPSSSNLARLSAAVEPPRQELLRRLNRAPGGTATMDRRHTPATQPAPASDRVRIQHAARRRIVPVPSCRAHDTDRA